MSIFESTRSMAKTILENADRFEWSLQGLGLLRLHMGNTRLHVWDRRFAYSGASPIHDHAQWALHSTILCGQLTNYRYVETSSLTKGRRYLYQTIKAGYGTQILHEPKEITLHRMPSEIYKIGDSYSQKPNEIHETVPINGTVTIMHKTPTNTDQARVFWPLGSSWGTAEPRAATPDEVNKITRLALDFWEIKC
jgi:predicted metal-dependent enzyme (double-stranded beta helix superfamily)